MHPQYRSALPEIALDDEIERRPMHPYERAAYVRPLGGENPAARGRWYAMFAAGHIAYVHRLSAAPAPSSPLAVSLGISWAEGPFETRAEAAAFVRRVGARPVQLITVLDR